MNGFFKKLKGTFKSVAVDKGVSIPITADRLLWMFRKGMKEQEEEIRNLDVSFRGETICISGLTTKLLLQVYFEFDLKPLKAEYRTLYFTVPYMKPFNQEWMKRKVLNKPPYTVYEDRMLKMDLDEIDTIKSIPVGSIKHFDIRDGKLWVKIGM